MKFLNLFFLVITLIVAFANAKVEVLNKKNFNKVIGQDKHVLVKFYAPWCGHCKRLAPVYEELAAAYEKDNDKIIIAELNADEEKDIARKYDIKGFPTIKLFPAKTTTPIDYTNDRSLEAFVDFLEHETGIKAKIPKVHSDIVVLNSGNFDDVVFAKDTNVLVLFYAPWCGHCKALHPVYEKVATDYLNDKKVVITKIDATENTVLAEKYMVKGYPHLVFFDAKEKSKEDYEPEIYDGGRDEQDFIDFLNGKCNTNRVVGGGLNENAGRNNELDELAKKFINADSEEESANIIEEASKIAESIDCKYPKYYVKVMNKINDKKDYVEKEIARLTKIVKGKSLSSEKIDDFTRRINILNMFKKTEENAKDEL
ncbi:ER-resident thioredoxin protein [Piromyces finnis]|uniref:protein disulfide-isomerase n=1 Tax=Piromyces finnis TaxID=1754191 RepID=A0A1Y1V1E3_9FUNG|nr:ER-resident thioredoxin protein [Piromyces finnis]|eukprot:ORX44465.1 ER-resident thioredoxin protein [Piromyces finnis]